MPIGEGEHGCYYDSGGNEVARPGTPATKVAKNAPAPPMPRCHEWTQEEGNDDGQHRTLDDKEGFRAVHELCMVARLVTYKK